MEDDKNAPQNNREMLQDEIKKAVESDNSVRENVRIITLKALTQGQLDIKEIRQVVHAVVKGAGLGAANSDTAAKDKLAKAVSGLDDALSSSAEASKLAVEEAVCHIKEFSKQDLKRASDDLMELESIYLDSLKRVAKSSNELIAGTLNDLTKHALRSGTSVGQRSAEIVKTLNHDLGKRLSSTVVSGGDSALKVASQLSSAAAGFLDGIAQTLDDKLKTTPPKNNE